MEKQDQNKTMSLSDKKVTWYSDEDKVTHVDYPDKDVKEFIKKLKAVMDENGNCYGECETSDKLAGDKLI